MGLEKIVHSVDSTVFGLVKLTFMLKVCSPEDMVGFTESAKCAMIRKIFDDAYRYHLTLI